MNNPNNLRIRIMPMPKDTNANGNIFGGWIMSQIDIAGAIAARDLNPGKTVTIAVNSLEFRESVKVGDILSLYAKVTKVGNTSIQTTIEVSAERMINFKKICLHVTSAIVTYVAVDEGGKKRVFEKDKTLLKELGLLD
ncbi:MAG: acyl-CoA thioesterase [Campylobacteraceae bacterium]|nr:acyl-CoA thioesterase [Campylobacteraceae bacterium]